MNFDTENVKVFKEVLDSVVDTCLQKKGITSYIASKVTSVNENGTINAYILPDETKVVSNLLNKTGESLSVGDSIEICTKNGKLSNAWVSLKHGTNVSGGGGGGDSISIGTIKIWYSNTIEDGWLLCDGSTFDQDIYPELYAFLGNSNVLPNLKGRVPVGKDTSQTEFNEVGKTGGHKKLQAHDHGMVYSPNSSGDAVSRLPYVLNSDGATDSTGGRGWTNMSTLVTGEGNAQNLQPYQVVNYVIKAKKITGVLPDTATVVDSLSSSSTSDALSANMGKILNENKLSSSDIVQTLTDDTDKVPSVALLNNQRIVVYDKDNEALDYGYSTGIQFPTTSNNSVNRTGLPDLTPYIGRKITIVCLYSTTGIFVGTGIVGYDVFCKMEWGYYDVRDSWAPKFKVSNLTSTTWTLYYDNSFVIVDSSNTITKDTLARVFNIVKVIIE